MNNKKTWILIVVILAASLVGVVIHNFHGGPIDPLSPTGTNPRYLDVPVGESFSVNPGVAMGKAIAPALYEFAGVAPGGLIDTWTGEGYVPIGGDWVSYKEDDPLWILVYNGLDSKVTFSLECINAPNEFNECELTGKRYEKAPIEFLGNVTFPSTVTIEPMSAIKVPVSISYPEGLDYPNQWECRISVSGGLGVVQTGLECRLFTYMS